ncbi:MAG: CRISPR-associated RAMP protein Csx7 [Desulfohalobiaceae bacterium]
MLKRLLNQAQLAIRIEPLDPLLVKSGQATVGGTDMTFVRTYQRGEPEPFLPGSSLKGVLRAYCEKICRSLRHDPVPVCLPYVDPENASSEEQNQTSCGLSMTKWEKKSKGYVSSMDAYNLSCPACRMFGSLKFTGRCAVSDASAVEKCLTEKRDGVAIDRITGGVAPGAKYDLEVLTNGAFEAHIEVRNFERWQLGLLGLALQDMTQGLVRVGMGKSRGLGRIKAQISSFALSYFQHSPSALAGMYEQCSSQERDQYGLFPEQHIAGTKLPEPSRAGLRYTYDITQDWEDILSPGVEDAVAYVQGVDWPQALNQFVHRGS